MRIVCVYVNDELEELSAEDNSEVEVCIHSSKEEKCECYTCVYVLHPFIEKRRVRKVYMCILLYPFVEGMGVRILYVCICLVSIHQRKGVRMVYVCICLVPIHRRKGSANGICVYM